MKSKTFKYVGADKFDEYGGIVAVNSYCGNEVKSGDEIILDSEFFIRKAEENPDYEEVKRKTRKPKAVKESIAPESEAVDVLEPETVGGAE